jgi:hypothetical protein
VSRAARILVFVGLMAIVGLSLATCSGSGAKGGPIEGRDWTVKARADANGNLENAYVTVPLTARFEAGKVSGAAGCNTYTATYTLSGEKLTVASVEDGTYKCDAYATQEQTLFMAALPRAATFKVDGATATIYDSAGKEILRLAEKS